MSPRLRRVRARIINALRRFPAIDAALLVARRRRLARGAGYPDWRGIIARTSDPVVVPPATKHVLIATSIGSHLPAMHMETALAAALQIRGAEIDVLLCDGILPGCQLCEPRLFPDVRDFVEHGPQGRLCSDCYPPGRRNFEALGVRIHRYSALISDEERAEAAQIAATLPRDEIDTFRYHGLAIGEHAKAGALRFFARAEIDDQPYAEAVLRRYLAAALLTASATRRLLDDRRYDVAVFHHGIYVPQGIIGEVARAQDVRVVNWNPAYRRNCFLFSHHETYHHTLMVEPVGVWEEMPWSTARRDRILTYLRSRWEGDNDWIKFHSEPEFEKERIFAEIGCDPDKPIIGCLTNVMWDAQLHYPANAFANMLQWLLHTIRYFADRPALQLVIRVHPAEISGSVPTRQPVVDELQRHFPILPSNIFVVGPDSRISTYVLCDLCNAVIIYGTKTGVELAAAGIPVIVAGEAWIRGKGITSDADTIAGYDTILDALPTHRLPAATVERALKYAYHFFFRRMIPFGFFADGPGWPPYVVAIDDMARLVPGRDAGLDRVCSGILDGTPFVHDDEGGWDGSGHGREGTA